MSFGHTRYARSSHWVPAFAGTTGFCMPATHERTEQRPDDSQLDAMVAMVFVARDGRRWGRPSTRRVRATTRDRCAGVPRERRGGRTLATGQHGPPADMASWAASAGHPAPATAEPGYTARGGVASRRALSTEGKLMANAKKAKAAAPAANDAPGAKRAAKKGDPTGPQTLSGKDYDKALQEAARRARQAAGMGQAQGPQGLHHLRGPRRRRQGRHDQGDHRARQPARVSRRRAAGADRAREVADVHPALHAAPAGGRRGRDLRPQLVQPRRRRARDGLLHRGAGQAIPRRPCRWSRRRWSTRASSCSSTGSR